MKTIDNKIYIKVFGMSCVSCAQNIKIHLEKHGFKNVNVSFPTSEVAFLYEQEQDINKGIKLIESLGYKVEKPSNNHVKKTFNFGIELKFAISLIFTIPLLLSMFLKVDILHNMFFQMLLTIPVYTIGLYHFGLSAYKSLKSGYTNMDVLIFTGSSAAFIYSLIGTFAELGHNYMFYETAASIITIVLFGNLIEQRSIKRTTSAIDELLKLQPEKAKRILSDMNASIETIEDIDSENVIKNDRLLVNEGDKIPVDGTIYWGNATVNESMLTGESIPVYKQKGDKVISGSILVQGNLKIFATEVGNNTVLSQIIELVKNAQNEKPKLQNLADKISRIFVPLVLTLSLFTFLLFYFILDIDIKDAIMRSIAVLVVACPCALGLAIPTAVVVAVGGMAGKGILIKGGITIEHFAHIKRIVFDKTGTLTTGAFKIKNINTIGEEEAVIKSILLGLEKYSSHPIAESIVRELAKSGIKPVNFEKTEEIKGVGICGWDSLNNKYEVGSKLLIKESPSNLEHNIYVLKNEELIATVDIEDEIKINAKEIIDFLKTRNITPVMLSGDTKSNCMNVAEKLGISEVYYEKLPAEKLEIIKSFDNLGKTAMLGDGINDAPALAQAGVGISLSNATHVAVESAQIILLNGNISLLKPALLLSQKTLTTIKQNLFWAFFYNILAIPFAAAGFLSPMLAALAMAFSDIIVVLNSLRLKLNLNRSN
ncbi:MAG: cation-translocating P-type ATPase [Bacteroidales bacterium]|nr:cation-translocating P-type ATPase [Bacteroidales bacterium]